MRQTTVPPSRLGVHSFWMIWIRISDFKITQMMVHQRNRLILVQSRFSSSFE